MVTHRRGPWSLYEDHCLRRLVQLNGAHNWVRISHEIRTRSPKQCRERYHQNLKPNLNHDPITLEEGEMIKRLVSEIGKKWAEIARRLPGRSDNAVKNWWNGCQHRRRKEPPQQDPRRQDHHQQPYPPQPAYHHPAIPHHSPVHTTQPLLPPIRDFTERSYYSLSRRPSLNPPSVSPHSVKLPHPSGFEAYPATRPQPLQLPSSQPQYSSRPPGYETPMPSPGYSVASVEAPSLVTDTGSEARSPHGAVSPLDHSLPNARRNSATRYGPLSGDDEHSPYTHHRRRSSVQLAPLNFTGAASASRDADYPHEHHQRLEKPQLLVQPVQQPLPPYQRLTLPQLPEPSHPSPSSTRLPSPAALLAVTAPKTAPSSPGSARARDSRMTIGNLL